MWFKKRKSGPVADLAPRLSFKQSDVVGDRRGHDLSGARFYQVSLAGADLRDASLRGADLSGVSGLSKPMLGGADLTGAVLPAGLGWVDELAQVAELSKNAATLFLTKVGLCAYIFLVIATTTDVALLTNAAGTQLPLINTTVPIVPFYWAAPIVLGALYLYFHLYVLRLCEGLSELPAIFPDGQRLDRKLPPWLINGLVNTNVARLRTQPPPYSWLQAKFAALLSWWLVPFTLLGLWWRFLVRHDPAGTLFLALILSVAMVLPHEFGGLSASLLRHEDGFVQVVIGRQRRIPLWLIRSLYPLALATAVFASCSQCGWWPYNSPHTFASVAEADVSQKPAGWTGADNAQIPLVKGAQLRGMDLRRLHADHAFLVKADFRWSSLA